MSAGYKRALQAAVRAEIAKLYEREKLPTDEQLAQAKRDGIATVRGARNRSPLAKKLEHGIRNAVALGSRKYNQV